MKNLYLIPTNKPSILGYLTKKDKEVFKDLRFFNKLMPVILDSENQNIYITNNSDKEIGDYVVFSCSEVNIEEVRIVIGDSDEQYLLDDLSQIHMNYCKKIILTTDEELIKDGVQKIDDDFIQWFVKNTNCDWVEFESFCKYGDNCPSKGSFDKQNLCDIGYKIIIPKEETKKELIENGEYCHYSGLPSPTAYNEEINPFELPNVLPDDVFNKSLEDLAEKEYPKLIVENPSCNGYNEPKHIDINEECRNAFMEGVKSDEAKEMWFDIFKKKKEKWNIVSEETPPSNTELLVKSPNGIIHLSRWRESYNIFGCQAKSESITGWKWKKI